ncbi:hypothetical protein DVH24_037007 [Malus domestica]|uniref:Rab proteins geranylgeranyltransferase component n=1 Tax=Malus domestica TaxID=3750 RepID=A0A498HJT3_MALDO|nr:hypothetical protein DVH24_037007 [Malus domestica]
MSQLFDDRVPITPSTFDLIVIGTGLPGSVIAAAASTAGKAVLHLDTNQFYGGHFASLPLDDLFPFLNSHASPPSSSSTTTTTTTITGHDDYTALPLTRRLLYSDIETVTYAPQALAQHNPKRFYIDLSGPKVLFLADKATDLLWRSGVLPFLCFKGIEMKSIYDDIGELWNVPDSRVAIFKDKRLSLMEKNKLMRFFKLVWQHLEAATDEQGSEGNSESRKISDEDLESPFVDFLNRMELPHKIKSIILYAIAMVDYDQDNLEACKSILKTRDGIERLAVFYKSRLTNAPEAMIYPMYGHGNLSGVISRRAAVKGCVCAQRVPVAVLMDKDSGQYKGVRLASGQNLYSDQLVMDPTFKVPSLPISSPPDVIASPQVLTLYPEQDASIRAIQIGGSSAEVCPKGMFVVYFSVLCDDAKQGKMLLHDAMNALLKLALSGNPYDRTLDSEDAEVKPTLLWSMLYVQELSTDQQGYFLSTPMPDANLDYNDLIDSTAVGHTVDNFDDDGSDVDAPKGTE